MNFTVFASPPYTPMNAWSPRAETNASRLPSGDHCGSEFWPRTTSCWGFSEASSGASQIWLSFTYAIVPAGEIAGE